MENKNEQVERETIKMEETRKQPSKLEVIGAVITVGWVLGQLPPRQLPPRQLPPDNYPLDNYPPRTNTPWTITPPR